MILSGLFFASVLFAATSGIPGLWDRARGGRAAVHLLVLSALCALALAGLTLYGGYSWSLDLPWALPGARFRFQGDSLSALFLVPITAVSAVLAHAAEGYWPDTEHPESAPRLRLLMGFAAAAMAILTAAANALLFLVAWEILALCGFLMITAEDREAEVRAAGWTYLVASHVATLCLFAGFALLASARGTYDFGPLPLGWASTPAGKAAFLLLLAGFGLKAGLMPLHVWLPVAHSAAPSHVSAFLSGLVIKMGLLGLVRLLAWTPDPPLGWGGALMGLGLGSAVLGLAFSLAQRDLKRALAYSSIENVGLIAVGLGLAAVGKTLHLGSLVLLGGAGALLHVLNHALCKPLLFLGSGAVLHSTHTRDLEQLGGLLKRMPATGARFLVGCAALSGLPPLNGFVSEWLMYLAAFQGLRSWAWSATAVLGLALAGGLALAAFTRIFGIAFLGEPRSKASANAHESPLALRQAMSLLAGGALALGLFPLVLSPALGRLGQALAPGWTLPTFASEARLGLLTVVAAFGALVGWVCWKSLRRTPVRRAVTWDCGYAAPTSRIQYTASSFGQLLNDLFGWALWPVRHSPRLRGLFPRASVFLCTVPDPVLDRGLTPAFSAIAKRLGRLRVLQAGHLPIYLLYVVLTLVALFAWTLA